MQDVRRKKPIKYNKDGSVSLDGSGVKILRLLDPQGEPDVIECDGVRYMPGQRYHQLSEVAREMYAALHINEHCSMEFICDNGDCEHFKERLEELGVEL